jgi:lipoprotein-releasing system permease protein
VSESTIQPAAPAPPPVGRAVVGAGHPAPVVFHAGAFLVVTLGLFGAVAVVPSADALFADRLALAPPLARALTAAVAALVAGAFGAFAGWRFRRLAGHELTAAVLLWVALTVGLVTVSLRGHPPQPLAELANQGTLVLVLALLLVGGLSALAVAIGAALAFLLAGTGRLDPSFSYELFIARSYLRLRWGTLLALLATVVTLVAPGMLIRRIVAYVREEQERDAYVRGELVSRQRMPATLRMTLISISAVAIGVCALIVVLSVMSGFSQDLKKKVLGHTSHGMLLTYGQDDFGDWRQIRAKTLKVPGVVGATPFTYGEVMVSSGQNLTGAIIKGTDVASVGTVIDLPEKMTAGKLAWLAHPEEIPRPEKAEASAPGRVLPGIVLGRQLALALRLGVGDQINVLSPFGDLGPTGPQPKSRTFRVAGIFFSGMYEYDSKFAYVDLAEAQRFFGLQSVTGLEVKVRDPDEAKAIMDRIVFALGQWPYYAKDWGELNRSLFAALQQEKIVMAVILGFMVWLATFPIVATLIMIVLEKRREIAVLKSMGASVPSIMRIFVVQGLTIGVLGALFGVLLGVEVCLIIEKVGIPLNPEIYYIHNLPVVWDPWQIALVALAAIVFAFLSTLSPAYEAARLHPVEGLRSE